MLTNTGPEGVTTPKGHCNIWRKKIITLALIMCCCLSSGSFAVVEHVTQVTLLENCTLMLSSFYIPSVWKVDTDDGKSYVAISLNEAKRIVSDVSSGRINNELSIRNTKTSKVIKKFPHNIYRFETFSCQTKFPTLSPVFDQHGYYTFFPYGQIELVILVPDDECKEESSK